ncbi:hypothetical protein DPMN_046294 [Dreissena polymorpha]|uniref:Uncharacterized protein n=1 Tax=Dreissena polymorpha TaxID=45954 RepID=A0A9D4D7K6_DREPO|nr:hypothetical protein DPMN_046294 [Dreissena polymorpha]
MRKQLLPMTVTREQSRYCTTRKELGENSTTVEDPLAGGGCQQGATQISVQLENIHYNYWFVVSSNLDWIGLHPRIECIQAAVLEVV